MEHHIRWIVAVASPGVATAQARTSNVDPHRDLPPPPGGTARRGDGETSLKGPVPPARGGGMPGGGGPGSFSPMSSGGFGTIWATGGGAHNIVGASAPAVPGSSCSYGRHAGMTQ